METKNELRRRILRLRDDITPPERQARSKTIARRLVALDRWREARVIFSYMSIRSEVETSSILQAAMDGGKAAAVPYSDYARSLLIPSIVKDPDEDLAPRRFGLLEPRETKLRPLAAHEIDVTIVPGSVFDARGGRIGYGMGFYDRFLPGLRADSLRVALAFEIQLVPLVPTDAHDCPVHMIITEERIIHVS